LKALTRHAYVGGGICQRKEGPLPTSTLSRASARRTPEKVSKVRPDAKETLRLVLARIDDMKAEDTVTIDLTGKSSIADAMVVTSGRSNRQVGAIADHLLRDLAAAGVPNVRVEGIPNCDWVLIDAGDVIVHVFRPEVRTFYNLERLWARGRNAGRVS
jgi:ribosome-associated protein